MIRITINTEGLSSDYISLLSKALLIEDIDRKFVRISDGPVIEIDCETITRCRAVMNSYIFWIYTVLRTLEEVERYGRKDSSRVTDSVT